MEDEKIAPKLVAFTAEKTVEMLVEAGAKEVGTKYVARVMAESTAKYATAVAAVRVASEQGADAASCIRAVSTAASRHVTTVAASQASTQMWIKVAGKGVGIVATPIAECAALAFDGQEHSGADYAEAGVRGAVSAATGVAATAATSALISSILTSVAAGAAAGSVVPGPGTLAGAAIGLVTACAGAGVSIGANFWMNKKKVVKRLTHRAEGDSV
ncbi:hypothetical protein [Streptomyces europaeiscabiei]|uniref:hypothetical protein n=1 Tax=Streptomyces europaeiscabiei TaxID=146819 RepID=UPI0029B339C4|nr:hypothetical protein [Streptomyces europaeiscabiei]MDX3839522.1 hypothetical protein [Streptomyces europaeiscabiei]